MIAGSKVLNFEFGEGEGLDRAGKRVAQALDAVTGVTGRGGVGELDVPKRREGAWANRATG